MIRQKCSIPGCPGSKNEIVRTYGFPKNPHLAGIWAGFCRVGLEKLRNARICERHFSQKQKKVCIGKYSQANVISALDFLQFFSSLMFMIPTFQRGGQLVRAHLKERSPFRIFELKNVVWWNEVKGLTGGAQMLEIFEQAFEKFFYVQDQYF